LADLEAIKDQSSVESKEMCFKFINDAKIAEVGVEMVTVWKHILEKCDEAAKLMPAGDKEAYVVEPKCDNGHLLSKETNFFCAQCDRKYYPENEFNYH
jgi:hypothetical protein